MLSCPRIANVDTSGKTQLVIPDLSVLLALTKELEYVRTINRHFSQTGTDPSRLMD